MSHSQNGILYHTLNQLLEGNDDEVDLDQIDPGWHDTCRGLLEAPLEKRIEVFQALNRLHNGDLMRLMASYRPTEPPPEEPEPEPEMPALPPDVRLDPDLAAEASPWLDRYIDFSRQWSPRSYDGYHQTCGLWLLSTIAARRVVYHFGDKRYTNLYLILAGQSTLHAKTRAAHIAIDVLKQAGLGWLRAPDRATPQAFLSYLAGRTPTNYDELKDEMQELSRLKFGFAAQRGWFYEEFGTGIVAMTRKDGYMAEFRGLLREFDDCPTRYEYITRTRGAELVQRPYLTMLANLTPADLRSVAQRNAQIWGDGFLARFAFIAPPSDDLLLARFPEGERTVPAELTRPLRQWHQRLGLPRVMEQRPEENGLPLAEATRLELAAPAGPVEYGIDADVMDGIYNYNLALLELARQLELPDLNSSYGRFHEKALRVAALLASLDGSENIHLKHWARGQQVAETWRASLHRLYDDINETVPSQEAELEQRILAVVRRRGNPTPSELAAFIRGPSKIQLGRIADGLVELGLLQVATKPWGTRTIKRYYLPDDDEESQ